MCKNLSIIENTTSSSNIPKIDSFWFALPPDHMTNGIIRVPRTIRDLNTIGVSRKNDVVYNNNQPKPRIVKSPWIQ